MKTADSSRIYRISFWTLLVTFVVMRVYVASPWTFVSMDEATYLTLARRFPSHFLYNLSFYPTHPPLYPYLIRFMQILFPDFIAGIGVSLVVSVLSFFLLNRLFRILGKPPYWRLAALIIFTFSFIHINFSHRILREATIFCLFLAGLTFAFEYLLGGARRRAVLSGLAGVALVGTSHEHGLSFIIIVGIGWLLFRKRDIRGLLAMTAPPLLLWVGWLAVRIHQIMSYAYLPIGPDGIIQATRELKLWQMFNPGWYPTVSYTLDLPGWSVNAGLRLSIIRIQLLGLLYFAYALNAWWIAFPGFILCLGKCLLPHKKNSTSPGPERYFFLIILIITLLPVFLTNQTRYSMISLIPIFYFLTEGFWQFAGIMKLEPLLKKVFPVVVLVASLPTAVHWMKKYPYICLATKLEVENHRTAETLSRLDSGGVMAQYGTPPELAYLTDRRVVGMPPVPKELGRILNIFNIRYLVFGDSYWKAVETSQSVVCMDTINYIVANPQKFRLVTTVEEKYRSQNRLDTVWIYQVLSPQHAEDITGN